jgi:hypothetical protein
MTDFERVRELYRETLSLCPEASEHYYGCLRGRGILPTPSEGGDLYAPNPVLVPGSIVKKMVADLNRFVEFRRTQTNRPEDLLNQMPPSTRQNFASEDVARLLWQQMQTEMPLAQLDAFFVQENEVAYLEWQTAGSYATLARWVLQCARSAWAQLERASFTAMEGWTVADLEDRLRAFYTTGIEDDPRQGVVLDYKPFEQVTRREFLAIQELTGGSERGLGIIDPREIRYTEGRPHYLCNQKLLPIRSVYSRLVHGDMIRLLSECSTEELTVLHRFFGDSNLHWLSHPLHFYYGTKEHFADFYAAKLSDSIPETIRLSDSIISDYRQNGTRITGFVYKPVIGHGGQDVIPDPRPDDLKAGGLLQRRIYPLACHPTLAGNRVPEIRLMAIPETGFLAGAALFTRVMHPDEFKSNAGAIAARAWPGTGEGYAFTVW